jgi:hypothetical protein
MVLTPPAIPLSADIKFSCRASQKAPARFCPTDRGIIKKMVIVFMSV